MGRLDELLASLGRGPEAGSSAVIAEEQATLAGDPVLMMRARWLRVALGASPPVAPRLSAPPEHGADPTRAWPWVGYANPALPWARPSRAGSLSAEDRTLTAWASMRRDSPRRGAPTATPPCATAATPPAARRWRQQCR